LEQDKTASDVYISGVDMEQWKRITTAQGGFEGPLKWYKAIMRGFNDPDETGMGSSHHFYRFLTSILDLGLSGAITQPLLVIVGDRDPVAVASSQLSDTLHFGSDVRVRTIDAGHFPQLEAPHETNRHLDLFVRDVMRNLESGTGTIAVSYERGS
jgi:soluble epoxide hydrolase/lipid-phosphate phosphatase